MDCLWVIPSPVKNSSPTFQWITSGCSLVPQVAFGGIISSVCCWCLSGRLDVYSICPEKVTQSTPLFFCTLLGALRTSRMVKGSNGGMGRAAISWERVYIRQNRGVLPRISKRTPPATYICPPSFTHKMLANNSESKVKHVRNQWLPQASEC